MKKILFISVLFCQLVNGQNKVTLRGSGSSGGGSFYVNANYLTGSAGASISSPDTLTIASDFLDAFNKKTDTTTDNNISIVGSTVNTNKAPVTLTFASPTTTWDATLGFNAKITLTGNTTLDITNPQAGQYYTIIVRQDGTGSRTLTLPAGSWYENGIDIVLTTTASAYDVLIAKYDGTNYFWKVAKDWKP